MALFISCWTAQIIVLSESNSLQDDHSALTVPGVPPSIGSTTNHSGGAGISSVGVAFSGYVIGTPRVPSAYSIEIAALYILSSCKETT